MSVVIGISEMNVVRGDDSIITYALGSCVGVALYDNARMIAGLAHIMMPTSDILRPGEKMNEMKYADTAIPVLFKRMKEMGASLYTITAKIAGGAQMFSLQGASNLLNIGERNVAASREALHKLGIRIAAEDVGENYGRTVEIFASNGVYRIKALSKGIKEI